MSGSQAEKLKGKQSIRKNIFSSIQAVIPKSCFMELMQGKKNRVTTSTYVPSLNDFAESFNKCSKRLKEQKINECPVHVVTIIMGYSEFHPTWQMKHGINTEVHAKAKYKTLFKKSHLKSSFKDPGMTIMESHPFISASPDLEDQCQCHCPRLVEIKSLASIIGQVPSPQNYDHIEVVDDTLSLKRSNPYFSQFWDKWESQIV